jgi:hypothetical protein
MGRSKDRARRSVLAVAVCLVGGASACSGGTSPASGGPSSPDASTLDATAEDAAHSDVSSTDVVVDSSSADSSATDCVADGGPGLIEGCPSDGGIPDDLRCTGLYSDWSSKTIAPDVMPYTPGLVFWSDGAVKSRWLYLPPCSRIDTSDMDNWVFPVGTKVWKQFVVGGQLVETRLLWKTDAYDWAYLDYRWSADGSSAPRLDVGETNVNGTTYEIPATNRCNQCHNGSPDTVLGIGFVGVGVAGAQGVTLQSLETQNRLTVNPPVTTVTVPEDATGKAAAALGWLHVTCGISCHSGVYGAAAMGTEFYTKLVVSQLLAPDGGVGPVAGLDTYTSGVGVRAHQMPNGLTEDRIDPGHADMSLVSALAGTRCNDAGIGCVQMPPLVSHVPDDAGLALVNAWINALPPSGDP